MDARVDPYRLLGLDLGDAHVIRNAGGVVTEEVIRSLAISQHKLGTTEVVLIGHTKCGLEGLDGDEFAAKLDAEGQPRDWSIGAFDDVNQSVREGVERIKASPFIPAKESVRGFVYDVDAGALTEVT
jgi:carbonic anhydrase